MRILQIAPQVPFPLDDGGRIGIYNITKYLHLRGHEIDFVCYRKHSDYNSSFAALKEICNPFILDVQTDNNILGALLNLFSNVPYNVSKFYSPVLEKFLREKLKAEKYDVVHVDHLHMAWVVDFIKSEFGIPCVLRQHNLEMTIMKRYFEHSSNIALKKFAEMQYKKFLEYEPKMCNKFDAVASITPEDERELLKMNPKVKSVIIPAGVDEKLLQLSKNEIIPNSIAFMGSLEWLPNVDSINWFLSEIFPEVLRINPELKFFLYGKKSETIKVREEIKSHVIIKGYVHDIWNEIMNKDVAIVPLRIGGGMRIKIIELLAAGQNIISTSIGAEGIPIEHKKHLLIADDAHSFKQTILDFFENKFDKEVMISNGKKFIEENFTWSIMAEKFESVFIKCIRRAQKFSD